MKVLTLALLIISSLIAKSDEIPSLSTFAEEYWSAVRSLDSQKIFALYDPKVFSDLSPAEANFMKGFWMKSYARTVEKQGDSYEITSKALPPDPKLMPEWRWAATPQYQIEIQTFQNAPAGKEGLTTLADVVIKKGDQFFVVRPVPPESTLKRQLEKTGGK